MSLLVKLGASEEDCLSYLRPLYANFLLQPKLPYCSYKGKSLEWHPYSGKKPEFEDKIKSLCWLAAATIYRHQKTLPIQKLNTQCQNIVLAYENAQQNPQGIIKRRF